MVRGWGVRGEYERGDGRARGTRVRGERRAEVGEGDVKVGEVARWGAGGLGCAEELEVCKGGEICEEGYRWRREIWKWEGMPSQKEDVERSCGGASLEPNENQLCSWVGQ